MVTLANQYRRTAEHRKCRSFTISLRVSISAVVERSVLYQGEMYDRPS